VDTPWQDFGERPLGPTPDRGMAAMEIQDTPSRRPSVQQLAPDVGQDQIFALAPWSVDKDVNISEQSPLPPELLEPDERESTTFDVLRDITSMENPSRGEVRTIMDMLHDHDKMLTIISNAEDQDDVEAAKRDLGEKRADLQQRSLTLDTPRSNKADHLIGKVKEVSDRHLARKPSQMIEAKERLRELEVRVALAIFDFLS